MKYLKVSLLFVLFFTLFSCEIPETYDNPFYVQNVILTDTNNQVNILINDNDTRLTEDYSQIGVKLFSESIDIDSDTFEAVESLYDLTNYQTNTEHLSFELNLNDNTIYDDDLYAVVYVVYHDQTIIHQEPYSINLYDLALNSSSSFAEHIRTIVEKITISSLEVIVNFADYTIISSEHSTSFDISTNYIDVTIFIILDNVSLTDDFTCLLNKENVPYTFDMEQNSLTIIVDDPNWTDPY